MPFTNETQPGRIDIQDLMLFRIYEILIVASPYDAFILEEGGRLTEQILQEYLGMNFNYPPRVWTVSSGVVAMDLLKKQKVDLVIMMTRIADMDPMKIAGQIKEEYPKKPVVMLAFDQSEITHLLKPEIQANLPIDNIFIWNGHAGVLLAIIKHIEDIRNASRDILKGGVRAIIFIEDTPKYYSTILPLIYQVIMYHTKVLTDETLNLSNRLLHLRARPKILLANNYEQAKKYFDRFHTQTLGIISDIRFPRKGKMDPTAGLEFTQYVRSTEAAMPIMLQSSDANRRAEATGVQAAFLNKLSDTLLQDIRDFVLANFGFGNFVFKMPSGKVIGSVATVEELEKILPAIPDASIKFHASSNHFSNWLAARGEFEIATKIRLLKESDFTSQQARKDLYIKFLKENQSGDRPRPTETASYTGILPDVIRIGKESMGGKARGLVFFNAILKQSRLDRKYPGINIRIPHITIISTDEFDNFMDSNKLWDQALTGNDNSEIVRLFLKAELSDSLKQELHTLIRRIKFPIAVRSSSILEDSQYRPLAGFYSTFMLTNNQKTVKQRFDLLSDAIKRIYASIYFQVPKTFSRRSVFQQEEKMAIIIMELIGNYYGNRFYPVISGTAQSVNFYPVSYMAREDGIASIALGFGRTVAEGGKCLRFCPRYPHILPQYYSIKSTIDTSQNSFYALKLDAGVHHLTAGEEGNLARFNLAAAEEDGSLFWAGSVISTQDNIVRDSLSYPGTRVVTFAPILKFSQFPLADILTDLLQIGKKALGSPVEIEFAVNLHRKDNRPPEFCLLQIKPLGMATVGGSNTRSRYTAKDILAQSGIALGNGVIETIQYLILVDLKRFDNSITEAIAVEIELLNQLIPDQGSSLLIGPGRWGTADPFLGIPVRWNQISRAHAIVEIGLEDFPIDPSFGSHFFQNVTTMRIGYFTINQKSKSDMIDLNWIQSRPQVKSLNYTTLFKLEKPLMVTIDGGSGKGLILKSVFNENIIMNEQESTGI